MRASQVTHRGSDALQCTVGMSAVRFLQIRGGEGEAADRELVHHARLQVRRLLSHV
jgi:hypothetical protein